MIAEGQGIGFMNEYLYDGMKRADFAGIDKVVVVPLTEPVYGILGYIAGERRGATVEKFMEFLALWRAYLQVLPVDTLFLYAETC